MVGIGEKGGAFKPQDLSLGFWSAAVLASQPRREPPLRATSAPDEKEKQKETEHTRGQVLFRVVRAYAKHLPSLTPQSVSPEGLSAVFAATLALDAVAPETRAALAPAWRALRPRRGGVARHEDARPHGQQAAGGRRARPAADGRAA